MALPGAILGIDIGGSGVKGAPVDTAAGTLLAERFRIDTPKPSHPDRVAAVVTDLVAHFEWDGRVGCTFPGVVKAGVTYTAANMSRRWVGLDADELLTKATGCPVTMFNDADAAGIAEVRFGAGRGHDGMIVVITLGTGIGSALFHRGVLIPNSELGHLELGGRDAESRAAARIKDEKKLTWKEYATRVDEYLALVERVLWPDLIIIGGGVSSKADKWLHLLHTRAPVVPAALQNNAGIVGAALAADLDAASGT